MHMKFEKPEWAIKQIKRERFGKEIIEDICKHGIGHPNKQWLMSLTEDERSYEGVHGCDGCCKGGCT